jgi:hypothetical protein
MIWLLALGVYIYQSIRVEKCMKNVCESMRIVGELLSLEDDDSATSPQSSGDSDTDTGSQQHLGGHPGSSVTDDGDGDSIEEEDGVVTSRRHNPWQPRSLW